MAKEIIVKSKEFKDISIKKHLLENNIHIGQDNDFILIDRDSLQYLIDALKEKAHAHLKRELKREEQELLTNN